MDTVQFHQTRRGVMAHFSADQCIGQSLARYGEWAEDEIALLSQYLSEGETAIDVGANVGSHTLAFAQIVGVSGRVIAIEAQPATFALLSHNVIANGLIDRVTLLQILSGDKTALVNHTLKPASSNIGATSFVADVRCGGELGAGLTTKLALMPIDSLGLQACSLIKIDVEGMELDVLRGATSVIHEFKPVIYFEYANGNADELTSIFLILKDKGYKLFWHNSNPFNKTNFKSEKTNIFGGSTEMNVLAIPAKFTPPGLPELTDPMVPGHRMSLEEGLAGVEASP